MKIVVTGATGFIGSAFVSELLKNNFPPENLILLQRKLPKLEETLIYQRLKAIGLEGKATNLKFVSVDFSDSAKFQHVLESQELGKNAVFVHLAAMIHAKPHQLELQKRINVGVTKEIAQFCAVSGTPFIYLSSVVAFGGAFSSELRSEKDYPKFLWVNKLFSYYKTKRDIHDQLLRVEGLKGVLLCPSIVHGSFEDRKDSRSHIKALLRGALTWAPPGGGNFVGLDRVVNSLIVETRFHHDAVVTKLLIDQNDSFKNYFQEIVNLSFPNKNVRIKRLSPLVVWILFVLYLPLYPFWKPSFLLGLFQGSLFLYFSSEYPLASSSGVSESLKQAYFAE